FKESSGIEYGADLALLLRHPPDDETGKSIEVTIVKNRLGPACDITFRLERGARLAFQEVAMPPRSSPGANQDVSAASLEHRILQTIRNAREPLRSATAVYEIVKGTKSTFLATFKKLVDAKQIVTVAGRLRVAVPTVDQEEDEEPISSGPGSVRFEAVREP